MTAKEVLEELKHLGSPGYRAIMLKHGAHENIYGVKISELKKILQRTKMDHALALELYASGNYDAMYLAGLMVDDLKMTKKDLQKWVQQASSPLANSTVAWVAAGSAHAWDVALDWIDSKKEIVAAAGWSTLGSLVSIKSDSDLDLPALEQLALRVQQSIHSAPNGVRRQMNGFLIALGCYVAPLKEVALRIGQKIGPVTVDVGDTACEVPFAPDYIRKVAARGSLGKKRKTAKC